MNCETLRNRLSAWHDEELSAPEREAVETHLAACPACRSAADELIALDARLRRVFKPDRAAAQTLATTVISKINTPPAVIRRPGLWRSGAISLLSAAAGFLLAWILFVGPRVPEPGKPVEVAQDLAPKPTIQLTLATGAVEVKQGEEWKAMPTSGLVACGQPVRTAPKSRCEFRTPDGCEVRLNHNTEVTFDTERQVNLTKGQIMSSVKPAKDQFQVKTPGHTVTALGTQFDVLHLNNRLALHVLEGKTELKTGDKTNVVKAGEQIELVDKQVPQVFKCPEPELMQATGWVHELLILKGRDNPEMTRRINNLMAGLGDVKVTYMAEEEIRALGDHCVVPLTRYLLSPQSKNHDRRRQMAARLIAELAQHVSIGDMIQLLTDEDPVVRTSIADGLKRLTGLELTHKVSAWQAADAHSCQTGQQSWENWWKKNQSRFPLTQK